MNVVKEYVDDKTKIRIHDDYISKGNKETKEMIISIVIEYLKIDIFNCKKNINMLK